MLLNSGFQLITAKSDLNGIVEISDTWDFLIHPIFCTSVKTEKYYMKTSYNKYRDIEDVPDTWDFFNPK